MNEAEEAGALPLEDAADECGLGEMMRRRLNIDGGLVRRAPSPGEESSRVRSIFW